MQDKIRESISDSMVTKRLVGDLLVPKIAEAAEVMISALKDGKTILVCGNGGSASQAQHFVAELVGRFERERKGLPAISLTADTSVLTALSNDYGFEHVFSRQVEALGNQGDVFVGITTSGNSENVLRAFESAKRNGMKTICLNGKAGGKVNDELADMNLIVKSDNTARIQESHIMILHIWCQIIEDRIVEG